MKIFLQDIKTSGHRIEYARYLAKYFMKNDHDVFYYTCGTDNRLKQLEDLGVTVDTFSTVPTIESAKDVFTYQIELFRYYRSAFSIADSWGADVVHQLCMNSIEIPLLPTLLEQRNSEWRFFGTYFAVRLEAGSVRFPKRIFRYGRQFSIRALVQLDLIDGLFVHHEDLQSKLTCLLTKDANFISIIPDPIDPPQIKKLNLKPETSCHFQPIL